MIGGNNTHEMYKSMQRMLNKLLSLGPRIKPKFNSTKTKAVLFNKKHRPTQRFLKMGGKFIKHDTTVKYLGLTPDRRLNWRQHINSKVKYLQRLLLNITNKYRHTIKSKSIFKKWIDTGVIRPKLTYGCLIWACLLYTSPSPRDRQKSRMPSSA